jgi:dTDP-4-dehydrorhamnose reductase
MHNPEKRTRGTYHLSARTALTPYEIAMQFADLMGKPRSLVTPILLEELINASRKSEKPLAPRPHYTILGVSKFEREFYRLPTAEESINYFMDSYGHPFS